MTGVLCLSAGAGSVRHNELGHGIAGRKVGSVSAGSYSERARSGMHKNKSSCRAFLALRRPQHLRKRIPPKRHYFLYQNSPCVHLDIGSLRK